MNTGKYVFSQIVSFLPQRYFERLVNKYDDQTRRWQLTHWNQLMALIFGQLNGCRSLRELTDITTAHGSKSYHLGMGRKPISRSDLAKVNSVRDYRIFEDFAFYMIKLAQGKRIDREFELYGKFYAFDSTTIDLCMSLFSWAKFRSKKSGIKVHTQIDMVTQIPVFFKITNAKVHDVNAMDDISYEANACYVFDRGYWDLSRLFRIELVNSFFVIREKRRTKYEIVSGVDLDDNTQGNVLRDQTVRFTSDRNKVNYPSPIRRIVYFAPELHRTFTYYTNDFYHTGQEIAFLYQKRWLVELFFKFIKQHLRVKCFWGNSENAVRIQIYTAIITYCLIAIIEHDLHLERNIYEVMRILGSSLLAKDDIYELCAKSPMYKNEDDLHNMQLSLPFTFD